MRLRSLRDELATIAEAIAFDPDASIERALAPFRTEEARQLIAEGSRRAIEGTGVEVGDGE